MSGSFVEKESTEEARFAFNFLKVNESISLSAPILPPTDMKIFSINSTYVRVTWQPLPASPWLWKTFNASTTGYNIYVKETSYPWTEYLNKTVFVEGNQTSFAIIGPLGAAREFAFEIAAANHQGASKKSDQFCVKMPDGGLFIALTISCLVRLTRAGFVITEDWFQNCKKTDANSTTYFFA